MRTLLICAVVSMIGCEEPPIVFRPSPPPPFGCSGPAEGTPAPTTSVPAGRVEVRSLGDSPDGARLRVVAEGASASQVAIRVGEALNVVTRADHELDTVSITLYAPDITIDLLIALLRTQKVRVSMPEWQKDHTLVFHPASGDNETTDAPDPAPIESRLLPPSPALNPEQLASLFCRSAASSSGSAQVIRDRVMITDHPLRLDKFASMLEQVSRQMPRQ